MDRGLHLAGSTVLAIIVFLPVDPEVLAGRGSGVDAVGVTVCHHLPGPSRLDAHAGAWSERERPGGALATDDAVEALLDDFYVAVNAGDVELRIRAVNVATRGPDAYDDGGRP